MLTWIPRLHPAANRDTLLGMNQKLNPPTIHVVQDASYREIYANSVQVRVSVWDFCLTFGTARQDAQDAVTLHNLQSVYLSPQQAKALHNILAQNLLQYEQAFGPIAIEPKGAFPSGGPVH